MILKLGLIPFVAAAIASTNCIINVRALSNPPAAEATEESPGNIVYSVDVSPTISTDEISADLLALDGQNVEGIEWDQKKSYSYLYQ